MPRPDMLAEGDLPVTISVVTVMNEKSAESSTNNISAPATFSAYEREQMESCKRAALPRDGQNAPLPQTHLRHALIPTFASSVSSQFV